jgi:hypothetical protein
VTGKVGEADLNPIQALTLCRHTIFVKYFMGYRDRHPSGAKKMVEYPKIVFTKTLDTPPSSWPNTTLALAKGDLVDEVNRVKNQEGKDIVVAKAAKTA